MRFERRILSLLLVSVVAMGVFAPVPLSLKCFAFQKPSPKKRSRMLQSNGSSALVDLRTSLGSESTTEVIQSENQFQGHNLFVLEQRNKTDGSVTNHWLVVVEMDGSISHQVALGTVPATSLNAEFINSTTVLLGLPYDIGLYKIYEDELIELGFNGHHEYEYNAINNTIFVLEDYKVKVNGKDYLFDYVKEYDLEGNLVWSLDTRDFISASQWCPYHDTFDEAADVSHLNTVYFDSDTDMMYINSRNTNTFYKIDHSSREVVWALGEYGDLTLRDMDGNVKDALFYHAHSVEPIDDNRFIIFDNDLHNQSDPDNKISRVVEIEIDTSTMTAIESWVWSAPSDYYCGYWGDADRLPNGNRLGTFGTHVHPESDNGARLVELNESGQIVWELDFPHSENYTYGTYRNERFRWSPILSSHEDTRLLLEDTLSLTWQTYYNYRPKRTITGSYDLYVDESLVNSGPVEFDKYWRPTNLTFDFDFAETGVHNVTLVVADEAGHTSSDSLNITVSKFFVDRTGPVDFEIGQEDTSVVWSGLTQNPLWCNLSIDGTLYYDGYWEGEPIGFNLSSLETGAHLVQMRLFNETTMLYNDTYWAHVYPAEPPIVSSMQANTITTTWNTSLILNWSLQDFAPYEWRIYVNSSLQTSESWNAQSYVVHWDVPLLDEGFYVFRLEAEDCAGHVSSSEVQLTVESPDPPIISSYPTNSTIEWGMSGVSFYWEIHGGQEWILKRNHELLDEGEISGVERITWDIESWQDQSWRIAEYILNLTVVANSSWSTSVITQVNVTWDTGDPYADSVVVTRSNWYSQGDNALGEPDGKFALVFLDYGSGYITLDMGEDEEIVDGTGDDFTVFAGAGEYTVYISPSLQASFDMLSRATGNQSFDLAETDMDTVRYITIEYWSGETVELDAIHAHNHNTPPADTEPPSINSPGNFSVTGNRTPLSFTWEVSDEAPWNYSVYISGIFYEGGSWNGSDITVTVEEYKIGNYTFMLQVTDLFGNTSTDVIEVKVVPESGFDSILLWVLGSTAIIAAAAAIGIIILRRKGG